MYLNLFNSTLEATSSIQNLKYLLILRVVTMFATIHRSLCATRVPASVHRLTPGFVSKISECLALRYQCLRATPGLVTLKMWHAVAVSLSRAVPVTLEYHNSFGRLVSESILQHANLMECRLLEREQLKQSSSGLIGANS